MVQTRGRKTTNSRKAGKGKKGSSTSQSRPGKRDPHVAKALRYIDDVLSGRISACLYVQQACQRQRDDLERFKDDELYYFDEDEGGRACRFIERLPHIKGPLAKARELLVLGPWQCFIVTTVFGWRRKDTGGRRFQRAYVEVPRGNGKSALSSAIALYGLAADGEEGAEVYSAATTRDQARIVWDVARSMLLRRPDFTKKLGIVINKKDLQQPKTNSIFKPLSREAKNQDGANLHIGIIDELHAHRTREIYDVLETAAGKRVASLLFVITTAGTDITGICYEVRGFVLQVLARTFEDETQFGIVYTLDEDRTEVLGGEKALQELKSACSCGVKIPAVAKLAEAYEAHKKSCRNRSVSKVVEDLLEVDRPADDWTKLESWIKANPNWGVSVMPDKIAALARKAMQTPAAQANFKTKHLDVWCNADQAAFDLAAWDRCADPNLSVEDLEEAMLEIGLDLASKVDICAKAKLFWKDLPRETKEDPAEPEETEPVAEQDDPDSEFAAIVAKEESSVERHYYLFVDSYLPEVAVEEARNSQYGGWVEEGWIKTTPGDVLDFDAVEQEVIADRDRFNRLQEVAFDPWQAAPMAQSLTNEALTMVEMRPTLQNFSPAMKELDAIMRTRRLHHNGNPVMRWMVSNVVGKENTQGDIYPRKEKPEKKIDGVVATLMALARAMVLEEGAYSDGSGLKSL